MSIFGVKSKIIHMKKTLLIAGVVLAGGFCSSLFAQTYSFTTAGASGTTGPNQSQVNTAYLGTDLDGAVTVTGQGIQTWTVPTTGVYTINAAGASGGYTPNAIGGRGRDITVEVSLNAGDVLEILVGQEGGRAEFSSPGWCGGGGGGSFIINQTTGNPILICGGGGGAGEGNASWSSPVLPGVDASAYNDQNGGDGIGYSGSWSTPGAGGTAGNGGGTFAGGAGGGGYLTDGATGSYSGYAGIAYQNGGLGGLNKDNCSGGFTTDIPGGFGGGAGAGICSNYEANGGGGGGYSGGGGSNTRAGAGGGGGNYYTGTYITDGLNTGDGFVTIDPVCNPLTTTVSATEVCEGTEVTLTATSTGVGTISWDNGVTDGVAFMPPVGTTTYTATSTDGNDCQYSVDILVHANPASTMGAVSQMCFYDDAIELTTGAPAGGIYSGNGVITGDVFDPGSAGIGTHTITYSITDTITGCVGMDSVDVVVDECLGLNDLENAVSIYPNPATNNVVVAVGGEFTFEMINVLGQRIKEGSANDSESIDIADLPIGTYTIRISTSAGTSVHKLIKQ